MQKNFPGGIRTQDPDHRIKISEYWRSRPLGFDPALLARFSPTLLSSCSGSAPPFSCPVCLNEALITLNMLLTAFPVAILVAVTKDASGVTTMSSTAAVSFGLTTCSWSGAVLTHPDPELLSRRSDSFGKAGLGAVLNRIVFENRTEKQKFSHT